MPQDEETLNLSESKPAAHPDARKWIEISDTTQTQDDSIEYSLKEIRF